MLKYILRLLTLAAFVMPIALNATHIVGGEIGYECLGGDNYEIVLDIYRDCNLGQIGFDNPAYIGVFDQNGVLVAELGLAYMGDDTITTIVTDPCLVVVEEVCVDAAVYRGQINLPILAGGYTIAYQRCCRNATIENIIDPLETGGTYDIHLSEEAMMQCNNSPQFTEWPAIYICANEPLEFDHSATDIDVDGNGITADSLVYSLCVPFTGGSLTTPRPHPPASPPYDTVVWENGFGLDNMLGTGIPLAIDPNTGLLTVTPGSLGQYVVGICVKEYRDGVLLSTTRRDFQYNVVTCGEKAAAFAAAETQCDNLTVHFENLSTNSTGYEWCFDYEDCTMMTTTTDTEFDWTFPDTGTYNVRLIAEPNSMCADTFYQSIYLQNNSLEAGYNLAVLECDTISILELQDLSTDNISPPVAWFWSITYGNPAITETSTVQNPVFYLPQNVTGTIDFTVTSQNGCIQSVADVFETGATNPVDFLLNNIEACAEDNVFLNPNAPVDNNYSYHWEPAGLLTDPNVMNPEFTNVAATTTFSVTITPVGYACDLVREVTVTVSPLPELAFTTHLECDGLTVTFTNSSTNVTPTAYVWDFGEPGSAQNTSTLENPTHTYNDLGAYTVTLSVAGTELCTDMITQQVVIDAVELNADFSIQYDSETCSSDSVVVQLTDESTNTSGSPIVSWEWTLMPGGTLMGQNVDFTVTSSQLVDITLTIITADGCSTSMAQNAIDITMVDDDDQFQEDLVVCIGDSTQLLPGGSPDYIYSWSPTTGIDDPTSASPTFFPDETTTYTVLVSHVGVDTCEYVEEVRVFVTEDIGLEVSGAGVICEETATLTASITTGAITTIAWLDEMDNVLETGSSYTFDISGTHIITVVATNEFACTDEVTVVVSGGPVDVNVPDTVAVCLGEMLDVTITNLDANDTLSYTWTPIDAFVAGTANSASPDVIEVVGEQVVYVDIENQFGCTYSDSVLVVVVDDNINLSFTTEVQCDGSTVIFTNTSTNIDFGFVWDFGDGSPLNYENSPTHNYASAGAGNYVVTLSLVYDVPCDVPAAATVMVVDPQIIADFDFDIVECSPDSAVIAFFDLSVTEANPDFQIISWTWQPFGVTDQNPIVTITESGEIVVTLMIETANGCESSMSHTIDVNLVELSLQDTIVLCKGDSTELNPGANLVQTYSWTPVGTLDDPTAANPIAFPIETTTYTVEVYAEGTDTCFYTDEIVVFVPGDINLNLGDDVITCGESVTINPTTDVSPVTIEWTSAIEGALGTSPTLTINPFTVDTIYATATDQYGCMDSDTLIITDQGVDVTGVPTLITACASIDTTITVINADIDDILTYEWTPIEFITGATNEATVTFNVPVDCINYNCLITNQYGCDTTLMVEVCVVPFEVVVPDTVWVCVDAEDPGLNPDGNESYTYEWSPADNLSATDIANPLFTGDIPGTYNYTVVIADNALGVDCETTEEVVVIVNPIIGLETAGDTTLCEIVPIEISATTNAGINATITWYQGNPLVEFATGSPISVTPGVDINTYTAIALDETTGCLDTSLVTIIVNLLGDVGPEDIVYVCPDVPTPINPAGDASLVYTWTPTTFLDLTSPWNPIVTTSEEITYIVTIESIAGNCFLMDTVTVIPHPAINPIASPDTTLCVFGELELMATGDVEPLDYTWFSDVEMTNEIGTGSPITVNPVATETYYVMATDEFGCSEKDEVTVNAYPIQATLFGEPVICETTATTPLVVTNVGPEDIITYDWSPVGQIEGEGAEVTATLDGTNNEFCVDLTNEYGCEETLCTDVTVIDLIDSLSIIAIPDTILLDDSAVITVEGCFLCDYDWTWTSGIIEPVGGSVITVTPSETGDNIYDVEVSLLGCEESLSVTVYVIDAICDDSHVFIPTSFSPNNDGHNDILRVYSAFEGDITEMELMIYNRWGEEVFRTDMMSQGWDGTYKGEALAPDVYGFYLRTLCPEGEELIQKGNITLLK